MKFGFCPIRAPIYATLSSVTKGACPGAAKIVAYNVNVLWTR